MGLVTIPTKTRFVRGSDFSCTELQQSGLVNDGCSCYMIAVILLLHRIRFIDHMLDDHFCSSVLTRNEQRSLITQLVRKVLQGSGRYLMDDHLYDHISDVNQLLWYHWYLLWAIGIWGREGFDPCWFHKIPQFFLIRARSKQHFHHMQGS